MPEVAGERHLVQWGHYLYLHMFAYTVPSGHMDGGDATMAQWTVPFQALLEIASCWTALQEQLAPKLESGRGPVEIIVVDGAEHPRKTKYGRELSGRCRTRT